MAMRFQSMDASFLSNSPSSRFMPSVEAKLLSPALKGLQIVAWDKGAQRPPPECGSSSGPFFTDLPVGAKISQNAQPQQRSVMLAWDYLLISRGNQHSLGSKPLDTALRPGGTGAAALAHSKAVAAFSIDVQLRRYMTPLQGQIHRCAVLRAGFGIVAGMYQEDRRSSGRDPDVGCQRIRRLAFRNQVAGIDRPLRRSQDDN